MNTRLGPLVYGACIRGSLVLLSRVLINAQIAAPLFMGHSHSLSKK
jgi:hypothetical protein